MMKRTTIMLPHDLRADVGRRAEELGISMGEYIRRSLRSSLTQVVAEREAEDSLLSDRAVFEGLAPVDLAEHHDVHLYGDPE
jgi:hypothetical protein